MTDFIAGYQRHLLDLSRSASTIETYIGVLRHMDRELQHGLLAACEDELRDWIFTPERSRATRSLYVTIVAGFFGWASDPDLPRRLDFNPSLKLPRPTRVKGLPRPIPEDQHFDILAHARRPYLIWFIIASYTGARCIEIAALDREHITKESVWLQGKGDKDRYVPTHPLVLQLARELPAGPVATDADGARLTRQQVAHRGNYELQAVLGFKGVSMHRLRHTFGTGAYAACRDLRAVQELMGHASSSTTEGYVQASTASMRSAVLGLPVAA